MPVQYTFNSYQSSSTSLVLRVSASRMPETLKDHLKKRPEFREPSRKARLTYLYSDLSQARTNNPTSFHSSVSWWSNLIEEIVSQGLQDGGGDASDSSDKLIWHLDQDFCDRLRWEGAGRPTGMGTVAMQMSQTSPPTILPLKTFQTSVKPVNHFSWPGWIISKVVAAPLWWSMSKIGLVDNETGMTESKNWAFASGDWVMMGPLQTAAETIMSRLAKRNSILERMFTTESFAETFAGIALPNQRLTTNDLQVILKYLQRDKRVLIKDGDILKVVKSEEEFTQGISEAEKGMLQVKDTSLLLEKQIADLETRIAERQERIAKYIRSNQKNLALSHLRSKKALEEVLSKRTLAYENIHSVLLEIESAETDMAVLSAYSSATASLKSLLSHPSLQRDNVENTMEALQDALADQKEIEEIITEGGKAAAGRDLVEDEIQEELKAMEEEARKEKEKDEAVRKVREEQAKEAVSAKEAATAFTVGEKSSLPNVPTKDLAETETPKKKQEAAFAE